jgi:alpha-ketoglutaric semialdehyde dehydrogenase
VNAPINAPSPPLTSFIDGCWLFANESRLVARENPGRIEDVATRWCPASVDEARVAMDVAAAAFPAWAAEPLSTRIAVVARLLDEVERQAEDFAALITRENGKPRRDARAEIRSSLADARHAIAEADRFGVTESASAAGAAVRSATLLEPLGVCLLITPWNFPLATILRKLVPALLYGNTAVVKPSELAPGPAARLFSLLATLPLPAGAASLVLGAGGEVGPALTGHSGLRAISFTGSTSVGLELVRLTAGRDVRLQLEMGGKNTLVVLRDADLDAAVDAAVTGGFTCSGQWCTGTGRVIVEEAIADDFAARLVSRTEQLRVGPGDDDENDLGPVVTAARIKFAESTLTAAVGAGARLRCGGRRMPGGHFLTPAVLDRVTEVMPAFTDELFVPVLPVATAHDADDAVRLANTGRYGLSASVFSRDVAKATALARRIEAGIIHVNLHTAYREAALPVLGWRESGRGLPECGRFARDFFTRPRALYIRSP